jgi:hypothetical protein
VRGTPALEPRGAVGPELIRHDEDEVHLTVIGGPQADLMRISCASLEYPMSYLGTSPLE